MHGLHEIKKLNARKAQPMDNVYGGQPTNPLHAPKTDHGILAAFIKFWAAHNEKHGEIAYGEARKLFSGGPTPAGTLIRAENGEGLRAVRAPNYEGRKAWYGEYREVTCNGTKWHRVLNANHAPIIYTDPEYALDAANVERSVRIEQAFR